MQTIYEVAEGLEKRLEELLIVSALAICLAEAGWSFFQGYSSGQHSAEKCSVEGAE